MKENCYSVTLNSDRAHIVLNGTPVETYLFSNYPESSDAIGLAVAKAMKKQKLTPDEKLEIRKEKKSWNWMIRMAKKKGALLINQ